MSITEFLDGGVGAGYYTVVFDLVAYRDVYTPLPFVAMSDIATRELSTVPEWEYDSWLYWHNFKVNLQSNAIRNGLDDFLHHTESVHRRVWEMTRAKPADMSERGVFNG